MLRKAGYLLLALLFVGTAVFLAGPRVDTAYRPRPLALPSDLSAYLRDSESRFPDITPGAEKTIVWARPDRGKTPLAIVYLHGFSATRQETAPLCDQLAARLGANLFYTRLTGHGRGGAALAEASVDDWLNDAVEALRIGERLGDRVLVVGCSTGGALAAWLAVQADNRRVLGYVLLSPNFAPRDPAARLLTWPCARQFVPRLVGDTRRMPPLNPAHARYWNLTYPTTALLPMMGVCQVAQRLDLAAATRPLLVLYSPHDPVIDVAAVERAWRQWSPAQPKELVPFSPADAHEAHVLAGDIRAPDGTGPVRDAILRFVAAIDSPPR